MPVSGHAADGPGSIGDVEYRVLGPVTVSAKGRALKLGGPRQRMVLAVLLTRVNQTVSQDALIETVWAGEPPETAKATLQTYISALRRELGASAITRQGDGYRIDLDGDSLDALEFEQLVDRGRGLLHDQPAEAGRLLKQALGMWYGSPYGGLDDNPAMSAEVERLRELRLMAVESRVEAELTSGNHAGVVAELEALVREHPLRERFRAQQMVALYRAGRQVEALRAFQQTRNYLAEELGIDPSSELRDLEQRILDHDLTLDLDAPTSGPSEGQSDDTKLGGPGDARVARGYELRESLGEGDFGVVYRAFQPAVGREVAVKVIRPEYANQSAFVRRFEREAQIVAQLEHPHIVRLYDFWREPDAAYLVMPYMRGGSLADALRRGGWNLAPALHVIEQVGGALAHAHRRGVIHRDVKPGNVLLDEDGNAYLSDFGIAVRHIDDADNPMTTSRAFVPPEEVRGQPHTVRSDVFSLGMLTFQLLTGVVPSGSLPLPAVTVARPGLPPELDLVLTRATDDNPDKRFEKVEDFVRAIRQAVGADVVAVAEPIDLAPAPEPTRNPYKGLRAFSESDALDFHGRDALVDELLQAMASHNLVAVVGPSGSGKSSVVRAGLIPALRAGGLPGSRRWLTTDMFPGSYPFEELEAALLRVAVDRPVGLLSELLEPNGLLRVSKHLLPDDDSTLVLMIDQFEELFSAVSSETTRRLFLENLVSVAGDERSRVRMVLTLRADFFNRPLEYGEFAKVLGEGMVTVGPPTRDGLAQAIAAPARSVGVDLEAGLVGRIIGDVENQPGGLPMLQYALTELFARREGPTLTIEGYEQTGGVLAALGRRAEELYQGLPDSGKEAVRQLFLRLVTVDESAADTRRRARQSELSGLDVDQTALDQAITRFGAFRLLSFDRDPVTRGPTIEVAHEALVREWDRLRGWIDERRQDLLLQRRISLSTQDWVDSGRDPSFLLQGARLEQAEQWQGDADLALTTDESEYLDASRERRAAEVATTRRRRRRTVVGLSAGLVILAVMGVVALFLRGVAEREARVARVRELSGEALLARDEDPQRSLHLALAAVGLSRSTGEAVLPEAIGALQQAVQASRVESRLDVGSDFIKLDPAGKWFVTFVGSGGENAAVFDLSGNRLASLPGPGGWTTGLAVTHDGSRVAVTYDLRPETTMVLLFDPRTGDEVSRFEWPDQASLRPEFSPDGKLLLARMWPSHRVVVWNVKTGAVVSVIRPGGVIQKASFISDEEVLIAEWDPDRLGFYSVATGDATRTPIDLPDTGRLTFTLDPSRTRAAVHGPEDRRLRVVDLDTGSVLLERPVLGAQNLEWSPDGTAVAYANYQPYAEVVEIPSGNTRAMLRGFDTGGGMAFTPDGGRLFTVGQDKGTSIWDVTPAGPPALGAVTTTTGNAYGIHISPDGNHLAVYTTPPGGFELFDLATKRVVATLDGQLVDWIYGFRVPSPDFSLIGSLQSDGTSSVRRLPGLDVVLEMEPCTSPVAFSPDNTLVVVSAYICQFGVEDLPTDAPRTSRVIEVDTGRTRFEIPTSNLWSAVFVPSMTGGGLVAINGDEGARLYDVDTGTEVAGPMSDAIRLSTDAEGKYLAAGSSTGRVLVIDMDAVTRGAPLLEAVVFDRVTHTGVVPAPVVTSGGLLATSGFDKLVKVWDIPTGRRLVEIRTDQDVTGPPVAFSADGADLFYTDAGGVIRRMPLDPDLLVELAVSRLVRDLTSDECLRYFESGDCPVYRATSDS